MGVLEEHLKLSINPFDPAASGPPLAGSLLPPGPAGDQLLERMRALRATAGPKLTVIVGEYGAGKTCCLRWLERSVLPDLGVRPYYFQDPGVQFYDLADSWLRMIGRKNLAKTLWELARTQVSGYRGDLFGSGYQGYAARVRTTRDAQPLLEPLSDAFRHGGITDDEEIAKCLAQIVVETPIKPHFEYRDFVPRSPRTLVAERREPSYFRALLSALSAASDSHGFAFLLDEFEEIGLHDKTRGRATRHYPHHAETPHRARGPGGCSAVGNLGHDS